MAYPLKDSISLTPAIAADRANRRAAAVSTDEVLVGRIAAGDRLAMQVLYARHHVRLYRFVLRLVRSEAEAEDLVSDTFLDVWRQAGSFRAQSAASTWLLSIARFKALSVLRRRPHEELDGVAASAVAAPADDPEIAIQSKDTGEVLRACVTTLSREHREVIDLVYYHEKSIDEVAGIVGIPRNTVKTRLFYARRLLSPLLEVRGIDRG
jgi:RNA polymerase sigma-70 factor (ECF subfamily)